jgi:hypothetical protein
MSAAFPANPARGLASIRGGGAHDREPPARRLAPAGRRRDARRTPQAIAAEADEGGVVTQDPLEEMGPIDYIVLEWPDKQPDGSVVPLILDAVDRGLIRILDVAVMAKGDDGSVAAIDFGDLDGDATSFADFEGASAGLLGQEDLEEAAAALQPGTSAAVLVWENRWAAPIAVALRRSGGQLVASGRIPVQAILASLDAVEATT